MKTIQIQVVGTGCATCQRLHQMTQRAAANIEAETLVEYVSGQDGMKRLLELGLMQSPALVVNDTVALVGANASLEKIQSLILENV